MEGNSEKTDYSDDCFRGSWGGVVFWSAVGKKPFPGGTAWKAILDSERQLYALGFKHGYVHGADGASALAIVKYDDKKVLGALLQLRTRNNWRPMQKK